MAQRGNSIRIIVTGEAQVGKTTFIQSALGRPVDAPSDIFPCFRLDVEMPNPDGTTQTIPVDLIDSPAFNKATGVPVTAPPHEPTPNVVQRGWKEWIIRNHAVTAIVENARGCKAATAGLEEMMCDVADPVQVFEVIRRLMKEAREQHKARGFSLDAPPPPNQRRNRDTGGLCFGGEQRC